MLQSVQNMSVKRIMNAGPLDSAKPLIGSLGMLTLENKRTLRSLVLFYRLVNGGGPDALIKELDRFRGNREHGMCTRGDRNFFIPGYNTDSVGRSFYVRMIKAYGNPRLPHPLREVSTGGSWLQVAELYVCRWGIPVSLFGEGTVLMLRFGLRGCFHAESGHGDFAIGHVRQKKCI